MEDKYLKFLKLEEENATSYYWEETKRENRAPYPLPLTADYWRGYADAATNALAAYAGPTDLDLLLACPHSVVTESHLGEELTCLSCGETIGASE